MMKNFNYSQETIDIIEKENLLPAGLVNRLHNCYPQHSSFFRKNKSFFDNKTYYTGIEGFREIVGILKQNGIELGNLEEREFFIRVYRFLATKHILNSIDWDNYQNDPIFYLVFPQPGMIRKEEVEKYLNAKTEEEKSHIVAQYQKTFTNPHDGKQLLNKPWYLDEETDTVEVLPGVQHKYPPVMLILDKSTQNCFAYCTYCFRHAQVRGDEDMFVQEDINQIHKYVAKHKEITDLLITGGDGGFITYERLKAYLEPIIYDPKLSHIRTVRIGSRVLTYHPEYILSERFTKHLELFREAIDNGVQIAWVSHFSTPRELLNPATVAAIRRFKNYGLTLKSQSPIMKHISIFFDEKGNVDIDKSAQNWIDLGNILAMLGIGFHSMYFARPTGEHHYFAATIDEINKIFSKIYKVLSSINRPSRYITQTQSAGKVSLLGTTEIHGEKVFVLKFNEGRNMDWIDTVYFAKYDPEAKIIEKLTPFEGEKFFYIDELHQIENKLETGLREALKTHKHHDK